MNITKIIVRDFILPARIGIYPQEQVTPQNICVNVTMNLADHHINHDEIEDTVSYEHVINEIRVQATLHHNLVETLAEHIAQFALRDIRVTEVTVQIEKLEIFPDARVGCCLTRGRN